MTKYIDRVVNNLEDKKFTFAIGLLPTLLTMLTHVPVLFIALYFGADSIANVVTQLEGTVVFHILDVVASALAAVGIAIFDSDHWSKDRYVLFLLAFFLTIILKDLGITMVTWAVLGIVTAGIYTMIMINAKEAA